jgi:hypothetical protein
MPQSTQAAPFDESPPGAAAHETDPLPEQWLPEHTPDPVTEILDDKTSLRAETHAFTSLALTYAPSQKMAPDELHCVVQSLDSWLRHWE